MAMTSSTTTVAMSRFVSKVTIISTNIVIIVVTNTTAIVGAIVIAIIHDVTIVIIIVIIIIGVNEVISITEILIFAFSTRAFVAIITINADCDQSINPLHDGFSFSFSS